MPTVDLIPSIKCATVFLSIKVETWLNSIAFRNLSQVLLFFSNRVSSLRPEMEMVAVPELAKAWAITDLMPEPPPRPVHWLKAEEE